jgi:hypothetical protein
VSWTTIGKGHLLLQANFGDEPVRARAGEILFSTHADVDADNLAAWEVRLVLVGP